MYAVMVMQMFMIFFLFTFSVIDQDRTILDYKELQSYLPDSIEGYTMGVPGGKNINSQGIVFSDAIVEFNNNDSNYVKIMILDYHAAPKMYKAATESWKAGKSLEKQEMEGGRVDWGNGITGWEEYYKPGAIAKLSLGLGDRFILIIEANHQTGTEFVKEIASRMDLKALASE